MRIRRCEKKDQETWVRLNKEFMAYEIADEDFWGQAGARSQEEMELVFQEALRQQEQITFILLEVKKDGESSEEAAAYQGIGFANLLSIFSVWAGGKALILDDLFIQENYRGRGYGTKAMAWIENYAREEGYRRLQFLSEDTNEEAHAFYTNLGYPSSGMSFYVRYMEKSFSGREGEADRHEGETDEKIGSSI